MAADNSTVRILNQKTILDKIYQNDGISKATLSKQLKMSKPTVSRNLQELITSGMVTEAGTGKSTKNGGKKPTMLRFNKTYRYIAVIELSYNYPICAIGNLKCEILDLKKPNIDRFAPPEAKKEELSGTLKDLLKQLAIPHDRLGLIVISLPGQIGGDSKVIYVDPTHHPWTNIGLKEYLEEEFGIPVLLRNDLRMAAIGEITMGKTDGIESLIYVNCSIGLGSGIVYKGEFFEGCNYAAGELGAFLTADGRRLGEVVSMEGLLKRIAAIYAENDIIAENLKFGDVITRSIYGDVFVNKALSEVGSILGLAIYNCCIMLDIPDVFFGGDYVHLGPALMESIAEVLNQSFLPIRPKIRKSSLGDLAGVYGGLVTGKNTLLHQEVHSLGAN
ncbi:MAG: ROK family transcriptional regulator [Oscillospiraceae bacterium]|nr:ROK family transcriptional regulator [Oscillospiraceae bacterium]